MFLYIMRHGEAKTKNEDPQRGLSDRGREEVSSVSAVLSRTGVDINEIWHSGKRRAEQTAGILAERLSSGARVVSRDGLDPNDSPGRLVEELQHRSRNLAIVGHLPQLGRLVSVLLLGAEKELLDLPAAGLVCLKNSGDSWRMAWFLTPDLA
jgi:phosphohistidine phosphatase